MKLNKLLDRITDLTNAKRKKQLAHCDSLKHSLKKLKTKSKELEHKISKETDKATRKELKEKLKIVTAQRVKGLNLLKELKKSGKSSC